MILDIEVGNDELTVMEVKLHTPFTSKHWLRLKYAHLPKLPLNNGFVAAVNFGEEPNEFSETIPPFTSLEQLCDFINSFRDHLDRQVLFAYYDGREFDLCTGYGTGAVAISVDLMNFLKLSDQQLPENRCWTRALFADTLRTYSHWNVYVKNLKGMYNGVAHSELLAKVRDDGTIYGEAHYLLSDVRNLQVSVLPVTLTGEISTGYTASSNLSIGLEFGV